MPGLVPGTSFLPGRCGTDMTDGFRYAKTAVPAARAVRGHPADEA